MKKNVILGFLSALCTLACAICLGAVVNGWCDLMAGDCVYHCADDAFNGMMICSVTVFVACVFMVVLTWLFIEETENCGYISDRFFNHK